MSPIPSVSTGQRLHRVTLQNPGTPVPDGDGGYTEGWADCTPPVMFARIEPAAAADLERTIAGTTTTLATHLLRIPYHPQVTTHSRVLYQSRIFNVIGTANPGERNIELVLVCAELVAP